MSEMNVSASLTETLKESDLQDVSVDIAESVLDSVLNDGLLKDIPIIGSLVGLGKTTAKVKDFLFLKKVIYFINELKDVSPKQREKIINNIDNSEKYRLKIGEKLLYILDKAEDYEKTLLVGKLFKSFLKEEIDYDEFLRGASVVDKSVTEDLNWFVNNDWEILSIEEAGEYVNWGVFSIEPLSIKIHESFDHTTHWQQKSIYDVEGADLKATITPIGRKLRLALR